MNKTFLRKTFNTFITFVLVAAIAISNLFPVTARVAAAETAHEIIEQSADTSEKSSVKDTRKSKRQKNKNQKKLEQKKALINETVEEWKEIQQKEKDRNEKAQTLAGITQGLSHSISTISSLIKADQNGEVADGAAVAALVFNFYSDTASLLGPWGAIASGVIDIAKTIFFECMGGEKGPSEIALMEDRLNQSMEEIKTQISEVQDQINDLADTVNESTNIIIDSVTTALENESDKNHLRAFMISSGSGDFSYKQFKNYLFGNTINNSDARTAYRNHLANVSLSADRSPEEIKYYNDLLYSSLLENKASFHDYVTGDDFGKSIVATYYDILSETPALTAKLSMTAETAAIAFASELYKTEFEMCETLLECNYYQYTQLLLSGENSYDYGAGKIYKSGLLDINGNLALAQELTVGLDEIRAQLAKDLAHILNINSSYIVEYNNNIYYLETAMKNSVAEVKVLPGQTLYLDPIPANLCQDLSLQADSYVYYLGEYPEEIPLHGETLQITDDHMDQFITLKYCDSDERVYEICQFKLVDARNYDFSGGDGTEDFPYLISTPKQFRNIKDGLDKHYCLIENLDFKDATINPFGYTETQETFDAFTGVLDGNSYIISNLMILGREKSGIFAAIDECGTVKNLTIYRSNLSFDNSTANNQHSTFTGGMIAGVNHGKIEFCKILECDVIVRSETVTNNTERNVYFKYGGVVGLNAGNISVVEATNSTISVTSNHNFGGGETANNQNNIYVGGICGTCPGTLEYASSVGQTVIAKATSILNPNTNKDPYVQALAGGITTNVDLNPNWGKISNLYAYNIARSNCSAEIDLQSNWKPDNRNIKCSTADHIPDISETLEGIYTINDSNIVSEQFCEPQVYDVTIQDTTEKYQVGAEKLNQENLVIKVDSEEITDYLILESYGFTTLNTSLEEELRVNVTLLFAAKIKGEHVVLTGTFPITIAKNYIKEIRIINYKTLYRINEVVSTTADIERVMANDEIVTDYNATVTVKDAESATIEAGIKPLTLSYKGVPCEVTIEVLCDVHLSNFDYQNRAIYTFVETVPATCQSSGYDIYICKICNQDIHINPKDVTNHKIVYGEITPATCLNPGRFDRIYCAYCDLTFEDEIDLPMEKHVIKQIEGDSQNHHCEKCGVDYAHEYVVSESLVDDVATYTYTCRDCGYISEKQDSNRLTKDALTRPTVLVGNSYGLKPGDLVTVYVDLINDPGVTGASFGIRYDERLTLVNFFPGKFFENAHTSSRKAVSGGHNFSFSKKTAFDVEDKDGNLLKLIFRVPNDAELGSEYPISVVYPTIINAGSGFSLSMEKYIELGIDLGTPQKFIVKNGSIRIVDRLPGDVINDNAVNLLDTLYLSKCLVDDTHYPITPDVLQYGDVNLSREIFTDDIEQILKSVSGGYGSSLLLPEYYIQLNTNGWEEQFDPIFVQLHGNNSTYEKAGLEGNLTQLKRNGYTFLGWHTHIRDDSLVDPTALVRYDQYQKIQTLYAHWEKNSVFFDVKDTTSGELQKITYAGGTEHMVTLPGAATVYDKYKVNIKVGYDFVNGSNNVTNTSSVNMIHEFSHWQDRISGKNYAAGDMINLAEANLGEITLEPVWGSWSIEVPNFAKTGYYITWYSDRHCLDSIPLTGNSFSDSDCEKLKKLANDGEITIYGKWTPITYKITYNGNGNTCGLGVQEDSYTYGQSKTLMEIPYERKYEVTFDYGIYEDLNSVTVEYTFNGWYRINAEGEKEYISDNKYGNWTTSNGEPITLYANWIPGTVSLACDDTIRPGYSFMGWYTDKSFKEDTKVVGDSNNEYTPTGNITLYAKWNPTVKFDSNGGSACADMQVSSEGYIELPTPTKAGHEFMGWYTDKSLEEDTKVTDSNGRYAPDAHITLYAKWNPYTVKFDSNGGSACADMQVSSEGYIELPTPTRLGHTFMGWYSDSSHTTKIGSGGDTYTPKSNNTTLCAYWKAYSIFLVEEDGRTAINKGNPRIDANGKYAGLPEDAEMVQEGSTFLGWYYGDTRVKNGDTIVTSRAHALTARRLKYSSKITLRSGNSGYVEITDDRIKDEHIDPGFNRSRLKEKGYKKIEITVTFKVKEIDDGYQLLYITNFMGTKSFNQKCNGGVGKQTSWKTYTLSCTLDVSDTDVTSTGGFNLKWTADGYDKDNWYLGETVVTVKATK